MREDKNKIYKRNKITDKKKVGELASRAPSRGRTKFRI